MSRPDEPERARAPEQPPPGSGAANVPDDPATAHNAPDDPATAGTGPDTAPDDPAALDREAERESHRRHAYLLPGGGMLRQLLMRLPPGKRGVLILFFLMAGIGSALTLSGVVTVDYSESTAFCSRCHTMDPEVKAYRTSPHREISCSECHIGPGATAMVKAKLKGTEQLYQVITGSYPRPILPPDHSELPPVKDTCMKCHSLDEITKNDGPVDLVLRPTYQTDEKNTRELVAVVLRPIALGGTRSGSGDTGAGVHRHVQERITYVSRDPRAQKIDEVTVRRPDGSTTEYISATAVSVSSDVQADIERLRRTSPPRLMDCIDCHNRVGHQTPSVGQALDDSIASGRISQGLPYIKREGMALLNGNYPSYAAADKAFEGLRATYRTKYPVVGGDSAEVTRAITELERIYRAIATPGMNVQASTYPNNLGHQNGTGCFRCHDGGHYEVVAGRMTGRTIPSTCSTCHTFPQIGGSISVVPLAGAPTTHADKLYVFNHKNAVSSLNPTGTSCGTCHDVSYCANCHNSGAIRVTHDEMLYNHAAVIRRSGGQACGYCHQTVYCSTCHKENVLQPPPAGGG